MGLSARWTYCGPSCPPAPPKPSFHDQYPSSQVGQQPGRYLSDPPRWVLQPDILPAIETARLNHEQAFLADQIHALDQPDSCANYLISGNAEQEVSAAAGSNGAGRGCRPASALSKCCKGTAVLGVDINGDEGWCHWTAGPSSFRCCRCDARIVAAGCAVEASATLDGRPFSGWAGAGRGSGRTVRSALLLGLRGCLARQMYFAQMGLFSGTCASSSTGCHTSHRMTP